MERRKGQEIRKVQYSLPSYPFLLAPTFFEAEVTDGMAVECSSAIFNDRVVAINSYRPFIMGDRKGGIPLQILPDPPAPLSLFLVA
jgi:hypothetical protein